MVASGEKYKKPNCKILKLSIIIPVYNSEKFLTKCLESVCNQDLPYSEYEIIIINDGSSDGSAKIIEDFQGKYSNVIGIKQENKGVSAARNAGLALAKGDYVTFVDSDDFIKPHSLRNIINYIEKHQLDVLYGKIEVLTIHEEHLYYFPETGKEGSVKSGVEHSRRTFPATFYKKDLIENLQFCEKISIGEDSLFNAIAQSKAKRVSYFASDYYSYRDTPNSLSSSEDFPKKANAMRIALTEILHYKKENFPHATAIETKYFDEVVAIFLTRIVQWNVLPTLEKSNFINFKKWVEENQLTYLLEKLSLEFPYINKAFTPFCFFQKVSRLKKLILRR